MYKTFPVANVNLYGCSSVSVRLELVSKVISEH